MSVKTLLADYKKSCDAIVQAFCKKQDMDFQSWVDENTCDIANVGDYFVNLSDMIIDLKELAEKGKILDWQNEWLDRHYQNKEQTNYMSYIKNNYNFFD